MSWNKNTINCSHLEAVIQPLKDCDIHYRVTVLGKVMGMGLNDDMDWSGDDKYYEIRKLEYKDEVVIEQMERHPDCDIDDIIVSYQMNKNVTEYFLELIQIDSDLSKAGDTITNIQHIESGISILFESEYSQLSLLDIGKKFSSSKNGLEKKNVDQSKLLRLKQDLEDKGFYEEDWVGEVILI